MVATLFPDIACDRAGIGFRTPHAAAILASRPAVGFLEVHAENYMGGGARVAQLAELRREWPISLHGVGLSLGSAEGIDGRHCDRLADLADRIEPLIVSEHLSWSISAGVYFNDLLPLPYSEETLCIVAGNVARTQDRLQRALLIENPSAYLRFTTSTMDEADFLCELVRRTGCGLLCDVNNIYVSSANLGGDPVAWIDRLPADAVGEIHLAGHCVNDADGQPVVIDDHGSRVSDAVWSLYAHAVRRFPHALALIEWDTRLPDLSVLVGEAATADHRRTLVLDGGHNAAAA
ncbi:MAG: DUF692 domain-containing protein [Rhodospirillales bacterium]|nr:DUF692 domain-containing protein [Rhodospirillales bacterium]